MFFINDVRDYYHNILGEEYVTNKISSLYHKISDHVSTHEFCEINLKQGTGKFVYQPS
jgi:hypothetical protein